MRAAVTNPVNIAGLNTWNMLKAYLPLPLESTNTYKKRKTTYESKWFSFS